jgi:probable rRNA maturation factor
MSSRQTTDLLFQVATPGLSRRAVRGFAKRVTSEVADGRAFCCLITSDRELRRLNREFREMDQATDVLSFPSLEPNGLLGEIAISFSTARRQASEYGLRVNQEIEILMLHGVLHLLGMDHEKDSGRMARAENKWRTALGLPHGLIERVRS